MIITQSANGKQVTLSGITDTLGTPTKIEISKGYDTTTYIQLPYISGNTYTMDSDTVGIESFFDSNNIWIDDIYELKKKALQNSIPYQNLLQMLIHQFVTDKIKLIV